MDVANNDKCRYMVQEQNKFRYGVPAYTGTFRILQPDENDVVQNQSANRVSDLRFHDGEEVVDVELPDAVLTVGRYRRFGGTYCVYPWG
jgi:hypothetical protein